jgi:hypothetical protein
MHIFPVRRPNGKGDAAGSTGRSMPLPPARASAGPAWLRAEETGVSIVPVPLEERSKPLRTQVIMV